MDLFVAEWVTGIDMISIARKGKWFIFSMIAATLIILYVPWISLVLPRFFGMIR
jgi:TRAP-type C4-dicarboxylate transport system permease large subunit